MNLKQFVALWQSSDTLRDVVIASGLTSEQASAKATLIRITYGIDLKPQRSVFHLTGKQIKELRRIAMSSKIVRAKEGFRDYVEFVRIWQSSDSMTQAVQRLNYRRSQMASVIASRLRHLGVPLKYFRRTNLSLNNALLRELNRTARVEGTPAHATIRAQARHIKKLEDAAK